MRVTTGTAGGRRLETLPGDEVVRPTADMLKQAMFSMLQFELWGKRVLDLFAGSGQLGIEALSRGAHHAVFVDESADAVAVVKRNLSACGLAQQGEVRRTTAAAFLSEGGAPFDIVFLDPPYRTGLLQESLASLCAGKLVGPGSVILCESADGEELPERQGDFVAVKSRRYSKSRLTVYRREEAEE